MTLYGLLCIFLYVFCHNSIAQTIQDQDKEYECVDFYKQPAFQHPSMKNHQIQMRPSEEFQATFQVESDTSDLLSYESEELCPKGQVPIHRAHNTNDSNLIYPSKAFAEANLQYAIVRTFENSTIQRYQGAQAVFSIYKPHVQRNQFSKGWIWLNHKGGDILSSIQFGWAVHTGLYRDDRPRLTTYLISRTLKHGCYNTLCGGGYVQVHKSIYPGMVYNQVSVLGKRQYTTHLLVGQDRKTKNWLLMSRRKLIGYWPSQFYSVLGATQVYYGGYAGGLAGAASPQMGGGNFPSQWQYSAKLDLCFMKDLKNFISNKLMDIDYHGVEEYVNSPKCYGVTYRGFEMGNGELLTFGGPGGHCGI